MHRHRIKRALVSCCAALLALGAGGAAAGEEEGSRVEVVPEATPYYTALGLYVPLSKDALPERSDEDELTIYRELLLQSLRPQVLLLEASVYPMPILGTWLRRKQQVFYADADLDKTDINWIESLTAGQQEPAALSLFVGSAITFVRPGEKRRGSNKGHMGYLLSAGDRHIRENVLIDDDWYEFEWKLKGERDFQDDHLSWSFRVGTKQHAHPEISDTVYFGLRRGNLDYRAPFLAWLTNSEGRIVVAATTDNLSLARVEVMAEKRYPLPALGFALALELGGIIEKNRMYGGGLATDEDDNYFLVLRPNIEF